MQLPTEQEINPVAENLDGQWAVRNFLGKSLDAAEAMFREELDFHGEDLMFMGPVAFRYYIPAACRFLRSQLPDADPPMIFDFAGVLQHRLEFDPNEMTSVAVELADLCAEILARFTRFDEFDELMRDLRTRPELQGIISDDLYEQFGLELGLRAHLTSVISKLTALTQKE